VSNLFALMRMFGTLAGPLVAEATSVAGGPATEASRGVQLPKSGRVGRHGYYLRLACPKPQKDPSESAALGASDILGLVRFRWSSECE
jgi:hypothetical protein